MPEVHREWNNSVETGHVLGNAVETGHALSQPDKYFVNLLSVNIQYANR